MGDASRLEFPKHLLTAYFFFREHQADWQQPWSAHHVHQRRVGFHTRYYLRMRTLREAADNTDIS